MALGRNSGVTAGGRPRAEWAYTHSIQMMKQLMSGRMFPLTLEGLDQAMRELVK